MRKFCLIILILTKMSLGQAQSTFSLNMDKVDIETLALSIEKQSDYRVYYKPSDFDSLKFSISSSGTSISEILRLVFKNSNIHFIISEQQIFLTKSEPLGLNLPLNFFYRDNQQESILIADVKDEKWAIWENKLYEIGIKNQINAKKSFQISGFVRDANSGEAMIGASVFIENPRIGISTDQKGYYTLLLPKGRQILHIRSVGMQDTRRQLYIYGDGTFNIDLKETTVTLNDLNVRAQRESNIKGTNMGVQKIDMKAIKQVPVVFGEADILKVVTTLPGVKTAGEASTGLNVRGGSADQNLILFNESPIYNPAHFFGMFSAFNPEIVKDVELYKSSIPAKYGGRLSSVLNINSREGNKEKINGTAGIGLLTSRLYLEGPIKNDKTTFIVGGRTTYTNWLMKLLPEPYKSSKASFYDVNLDISHSINQKNQILLSAYLSQDQFNLGSDTLFSYGNKNASLKWNHTFTEKLKSQIVLGHTAYKYQIESPSTPIAAFSLGFDINQSFLKANFNYFLSSKHSLDFGINTMKYKLHPGSYLPLGPESLVVADRIPAEQALESAAYFSDVITINEKLTLDAGIRLSLYNYLGPHAIKEYTAGVPKTVNTLENTIQSTSTGVLKTYGAPEYRFSLRYILNKNLSLKAGFNTQRQYIHSISNTATVAPTDVWKLSDNNIKPQKGNQISLGLYSNFKENDYETSVEIYSKGIQNFLDFKSGAILVMNPHIETDVIPTKGKAYGAEFLVKKVKGRLSGWMSYTYSRILLKMDDPLEGEILNFGNYYPANYDKPHDFTLISNYFVSHRFSTSFNVTYSTGRPVTLPAGVYYYGGSLRTLYLERNGYRIPNYFRTDFSINIDGNHKIHQKTHNSWTIGVYNLTARKNPYSVYYITENGKTNGYKLSIFGSAIPFINYNIKF